MSGPGSQHHSDGGLGPEADATSIHQSIITESAAVATLEEVNTFQNAVKVPPPPHLPLSILSPLSSFFHNIYPAANQPKRYTYHFCHKSLLFFR